MTLGAACTSGPPADTRSLNGAEGDLVAGTGSLTGTYGGEAIAPIKAAYWIGQPDDPAESAGGPFVNLFSTAVTCNDISVTGWLSNIPPETQVLELIIGTTKVGASNPAASGASANHAEVNYLFGHPGAEQRAGGGSVTLTTYTTDVAVDGTVNVTFSSGSAEGTFHAVYCPGGQEESR
ncbi:hypothetical protein BH11MYX3_BH11MYX3_10930 [soil metagenome]